MSALLDIEVRRHEYQAPPQHHIPASKPAAGWTSYLPSWNPSAGSTRSPGGDKRLASRGTSSSSNDRQNSTRKAESAVASRKDIAGFRNPWPSWHEPSKAEIWRALEWGEETDPCIEVATARLRASSDSTSSSSTSRVSNNKLPTSAKKQAAQLLCVEKPDFRFDHQRDRAKTTWLGHAGVLIQLPPLKQGDRPARCLFDPMFSMRSSPVQTAGPRRSYAPPCEVEDLPEIDLVMISHNHYDHLDFSTIMALWKHNRETVRFIVPLGNRRWFIECGVSEDRVTELDWWDEILIRPQQAEAGVWPLKIACTPAQHNSGRSGFDANATLWSSWYLEHPGAAAKPYRIYFAGDTGYQFHDSPGWPPSPASSKPKGQPAARVDDDSIQSKHPVCPAFKDITNRLGRPHLLLLPVSVGATYDFFRNFSSLPDSVNPIPRHSPGVTAHNHMPPWDAVRVLKAMTADVSSDNEPPVAVAMHWGTFVTEPVEVLKTLGQLEWACEAHGVEFARSLPKTSPRDQACFLALNHGQSVAT